AWRYRRHRAALSDIRAGTPVPLLERMRTDQMVPLGAALAALTMGRGTLATILTAAAIMGLPAAVLAPGLLAFRATAQGRGGSRGQRSGRKKSRRSEIRRSGASRPAKWPPR